MTKLEELRALREKATKGEWHPGSLPPPSWRYITADDGDIIAAVAEWNSDGTLIQEFKNAQAKSNAFFIAALVNWFDSHEAQEVFKNDERYRWLREHHLQLGPDNWIRTGDDLDEAIDAGART